jgi:two-component system NarL family sensor kinase
MVWVGHLSPRRPTMDTRGVDSPRRSLTVVAAVGSAAVLAALVSMVARGRPATAYYDTFLLINGPSALVLLWTSRLVLGRAPGHGAGRTLLAIGIVSAAHAVVSAIVDARVVAAGFTGRLTGDPGIVPADLPLDASVPLLMMSWIWVPAPVLAIAILPLLFPDGRLPSSRWRPVVGVAAAGGVLLMVAFAIDAWPTADWWLPEDAPAVVGTLALGGAVLVLAAAGAALLALARRWRRASGAGPFRAVATAAAVFVVVATVTYPWQALWTAAVLVAFNALAVVYALAVARFGLHDVEPAIGRATVTAAVSVLFVAGYLLVVVAVGGLVGPFDTALAAVTIGVVALLAEPARRGLSRTVDRVLYRRRADRGEVLSQMARHAGRADVVTEVAELLTRSTGARRVEVWLDEQPADPMAVAGPGAPAPPILVVPVEHADERFGELRLSARAAADLVPDAAQLVGDVAHALGLILHNDQLTRRLQAQLHELRASRQRLVEAQDHARRGLERDIHDGAQVRLVALRLRLGRLRVLAGPMADEIDVLEREVDATIRTLRDLARGLHPPILEQAGPAEALRAYTGDLPATIVLETAPIGRHPRAVEGAIYFFCMEAIQNAIQHGHASRIAVALASDDGVLRCRIEDDGTGFDPARAHTGTGLTNVADRASALGGTLLVDAEPGRGSRLVLELPGR